MLFRQFFLVTIFLMSACHNKKQPMLSAYLTTEEKADLEYFFRFLIFENYGAFVLFGSKPLCEMHLSDLESKEENKIAFQKWLKSLPEDEQIALKTKLEKLAKKTNKQIELKRNLYSGWLAWEKVRKTFSMKRYILSIIPMSVPGRHHEIIPGSYQIIFADIQQTAIVMAENETIFRNAGEMEFHPLQTVLELQNPNSVFWNNVFSVKNHLAKGLLFGFGLRNSIFGNWYFTYLDSESAALDSKVMQSEDHLENRIIEYLKNANYRRSTVPVNYTKGSPSNFTIPLFGVVDGDCTAEKYIKEKIAIEAAYQGRDLVEVTLQRLAN